MRRAREVNGLELKPRPEKPVSQITGVPVHAYYFASGIDIPGRCESAAGYVERNEAIGVEQVAVATVGVHISVQADDQPTVWCDAVVHGRERSGFAECTQVLCVHNDSAHCRHGLCVVATANDQA